MFGNGSFSSTLGSQTIEVELWLRWWQAGFALVVRLQGVIHALQMTERLRSQFERFAIAGVQRQAVIEGGESGLVLVIG